MTWPTVLLIAALLLITALLYSSVGHAGGSGFIAVMALLGVVPAVMRPTALVLNILVSTIATVKFHRAGFFSWRLFWPFAASSTVAAFLGGGITLPSNAYRILVGLILLYAAVRTFLTAKAEPKPVTAPHILVALFAGAIIGLLSGLTGVGGGIFLTPLLLFMGWAETKQAAGVSAPFILVNSCAGLLGQPASVAHLTGSLGLWALAAGIGGWFGAEFGSRRLQTATLRQALSVVLLVAGLKMILV